MGIVRIVALTVIDLPRLDLEHHLPHDDPRVHPPAALQLALDHGRRSRLHDCGVGVCRVDGEHGRKRYGDAVDAGVYEYSDCAGVSLGGRFLCSMANRGVGCSRW